MNSHVGSLARFRNKHTLSIEPFSSKSDLKKRAVSMLTWNKKQLKKTSETPNKPKVSLEAGETDNVRYFLFIVKTNSPLFSSK